MIRFAKENCTQNNGKPICSYDENTSHSGVKVYADGKECTVFSSSNCDFVKVFAPDFVSIKVEYTCEIKSAVIRPARYNRKIDFSGNVAAFNAKCGDYICVEFNEDIKKPLFVFVDKKKELFDYNNCDVIYYEDNKIYNADIIIENDNTVVFIGENTIVRGRVYAEKVKNIKIIGNGVIDGTGVCENVMQVDGTSVVKRARSILFENCENIEISGITAMSAGTWITDFENCENVHIEDYQMLGDVMCSDGIDIVSSQNVYIHHIFVRNEDDCVCIKAGRNAVSTNEVKNVYVSDCVLWSNVRGNGLEIGYELMENVSDVVFRNVDIIHRFTQDHKFNRTALSIHNAGRAVVKNVLYENIYIEHSDENFIMASHIIKKDWGDGAGAIEDITYRNIHLLGGEVNPPSYISTHPINVDEGGIISDEIRPVKNIVFENVYYKGRKLDSIDTAKECGFVISDDVTIKLV